MLADKKLVKKAKTTGPFAAHTVELLLLAITFGSMALLFSPTSSSTERTHAMAPASQRAASTCGFAVTGEIDVSGACS